ISIFYRAEDGIRDRNVTGVQTCALPITPITYTVTFDADDGEVAESNKKVEFGAVYGELPVPTRNGYTFVGWYLNDELVNADTREIGRASCRGGVLINIAFIYITIEQVNT